MEIVLSVLGSSVVASIVSAIISALERKSRAKGIDRLLLLNALKQEARHCIDEGFVELKDLECVEAYYKEYKALGGDGFADTLMGKVRSLPIR